MPSLTNVQLSKRAFADNPSISIHGIAMLSCLRVDAGALAEFFKQPDSLATANVHSIVELYGLETTIKTIVVDNNSCNDEDFTQLDLSPFVNLVHFEVGSFSFADVDYVIIDGMQFLESIIIGEKSFVDYHNVSSSGDTDKSLSIQDCPMLKVLKVQNCSFKFYKVLSLKNLSAFETLDMGSITMAGECFAFARLELVSSTKYCLSVLDLPAVKQLVFPRQAFMVSRYAAFESISIGLILPFRFTRTGFNSAWAWCISILSADCFR